ncbi:MAG: hypothetical protein IPJ95_00815 [Gemmatimonadetes bacterium]|nr:hypothetical protein [Gemmatimonadota bacterium]MBK6779899.1 hypothetical protein [Gemmatimonadota bacterium]MBK7922170.1 hypothetical protein [Gemmatimonadota bacterium]
MKTILGFAIPFAVLATIACSDSTAPGPITGSYRLSKYNGLTVPVGLSAGGCTQYVNAGTFTLGADDSWVALLTVQTVCPTDTTAAPAVTISYHGTYQQVAAGLRIWISNSPPEELALAATDGSHLSLDFRPYYGALTEYERAP